MKAIVQDRYGSADVLELRDVEKPQPGDDGLLIRIHAAGVDPGVWHLMTGLPYLVRVMGFGFRKPKIRIRGTDAAGTVEAAGRNVTQLKQGDLVYGTCDGSFAEYACARAERFAPKPANLSFEQAAAVPISGMTALNGLRDAGKLQPGQKVLIRTFCPGWSLPESRRPLRAVMPEMGTAAACSKLRFAGLGAKRSALAQAYSAKEPSHVPYTRSPCLSWLTFLPAASTVPAASMPRMRILGWRKPKPMTRTR